MIFLKLLNWKYFLSKNEWLIFYRGRPTIGFKPIEQQICVDESQRLCSYYRPDYIHCVNAGTQTGGQGNSLKLN